MTEQNQSAASLTSEPEKLLPCPFCGARAHQGLTKVEHCQLHGDPIQRFEIWCPHHCARINRVNRAQAITTWNTRLSSPVSGTDMAMVPRTLAEKLAKFATEWDRWQAKGSTSTERMVTFSYGQARIGLDDFRAVHALLSASPTPPIPVIAEAGERETISPEWCLRMAELEGEHGSEIGAGALDHPLRLPTPATLDNTAVEACAQVCDDLAQQARSEKRDPSHPLSGGIVDGMLERRAETFEQAASAIRATLTAKTEEAA